MAGSKKDGPSNKSLPSWGPKSLGLSKDNRFIDLVNLKLGELIGRILTLISDTSLLVGNRKCNDILEEYKTLTEQNGERINFVGPQPVSMSRQMLDPDYPHNILKGYVVTEKADGIRAELFIDKNHEGYLITQKKEIIFTSKKNLKSQKLKQLGCEIIEMRLENNKLNLKKLFTHLYRLKISDLLVEAGGILFADLLKNNLIDEIHLFKAPFTIGKKGIPVIKENDLKNIKKKLLETIKFDDNLYFKYEIK